MLIYRLENPKTRRGPFNTGVDADWDAYFADTVFKYPEIAVTREYGNSLFWDDIRNMQHFYGKEAFFGAPDELWFHRWFNHYWMAFFKSKGYQAYLYDVFDAYVIDSPSPAEVAFIPIEKILTRTLITQ